MIFSSRDKMMNFP